MTTSQLQSVKSIDDVKTFFLMIKEEIGNGYHPDTDFADYIDYESKLSAYSEQEAALRNALNEQAFTVCEANGEDIYALANEICHGNISELLRLMDEIEQTAAESVRTGVFGYLDCSTAHITAEDANALTLLADSEDSPFTIAKTSYGFWVSVPEETDEQTPASLRPVLAKAQAQRCSGLLLDADGTRHADLPYFDWNA